MSKKYMLFTCKTICLVALYLSIVIPVSNAETWSRVKVVTLTGWEYQNVTVETVPNQPFIVIINPDGATKQLSRSNIALILDESGKDITAMVLANLSGAKAAPDDTTAVSTSTSSGHGSPELPLRRSSKDYRTIRRRPPGLIYGPRYRLAMSGGGGYSFATGDWFSGLNNGLSFNACGRLALTECFYIGVSYRYQRLGVDRNLEESYIVVYDEYGYPVGTLSVDFDVYLNETYFLVGFMTEPATYTSPLAFLEIGLGGIDHNIKATVSDGTEAASASMDETKFGLLMTVGGVFPFNKTLGLCLEGNMRITGQGDSNPYDYYDQGSSGVLFGVGISLVMMVGK
jgi:hypothetical protein